MDNKEKFKDAFANLNLHPELRPISKSAINERLEAFKIFTAAIEKKYSDEYTELADKANKIEASIVDEEDDSNVPYHFYESMKDIEFSFIRQHRSSSIIIAYTFLEKSMLSLCEKLEKKLKIGISVNDLKHQGITATKIYLEKLALIDFKPINALWGRLSELNTLRNCLVHNDGILEGFKSEKTLRGIIESNKLLSISPYGSVVIIEFGYIESITETIKEFLNYLLQQENNRTL